MFFHRACTNYIRQRTFHSKLDVPLTHVYFLFNKLIQIINAIDDKSVRAIVAVLIGGTQAGNLPWVILDNMVGGYLISTYIIVIVPRKANSAHGDIKGEIALTPLVFYAHSVPCMWYI